MSSKALITIIILVVVVVVGVSAGKYRSKLDTLTPPEQGNNTVVAPPVVAPASEGKSATEAPDTIGMQVIPNPAATGDIENVVAAIGQFAISEINILAAEESSANDIASDNAALDDIGLSTNDENL